MKLVLAFLATFVAMATSLTALDQFSAGNLQFTARLYNEVLRENPNKNFVFSPLSIEIIFALARAGAKGPTAAEFSSSLNLPSEEATEQALKQLLPALKHNKDDLKLSSANKMYLGKKFEIRDSFKKIATDIFDASAENVDFSQSNQAANIINQWVEAQTNNKIQNLISPDSLDATTRLVLVNALYFSGKWETPFEKLVTKKDKFYISNTQTKEVDMMRLEDSFRYFESKTLNAKFLELPYLGGNVSMTIVLPNEREGLLALENNVDKLLEPQNLQYERVAVHLPRFLVESEVKLVPILKRLGLTTAFSDAADFTGISKEALKIDDAIQKAFINVTESGTEAAAATAIFFARSAKLYFQELDEIVFRVDHPFMYVIRLDNMILFSGHIVV